MEDGFPSNNRMKNTKRAVIKYLWITLCCALTLCGCADKGNYIPVESEDISTVVFENSDEAKKIMIFDKFGESQTSEEIADKIPQESPALPAPGIKSMENLLLTALVPVGSTMYVWGGGWNEEDTGAGIEAMSFGVSARWEAFAAEQTSVYDYKKTEYQIHDGLDCSGYIGWLIYNVFETEEATVETMATDTGTNSKTNDGTNIVKPTGYVYPSTQMAEKFAANGWGEYLTDDITEWKPGDICSMPGHVWMSLGMCEDGSVLLVHASPPGVRLSGTRLKNGEKSQAIKMAEEYMKENHPQWYEKYPASDVSYNYLTKSKVFRWAPSTMEDTQGIQDMTAAEVLELLEREE